MPIDSLHHIALVARNPEALAAFYRDVLGLTPHSVPAGSTSRWFVMSGTILMIEAADGTQTAIAGEEHAHLHTSEPGSEMKKIEKE
ncbi:MAG: VOC family protein, partial [Leptospiraceae bacterium]|nr:VOC family protein [Leptospiraceae bacterium]